MFTNIYINAVGSMTEETYQEVVDKISEDEIPHPESGQLDKCETIEEETTDFESETKPVEKIAMKKKQPSCRAKLRDKVTCPKCSKELSRHSYEYTHSKFCKGKPDKPEPVEEEEEEEEEVKEIIKKMEQMTITELIEETKPKPKPKAKARPKATAIQQKVEDKSVGAEPPPLKATKSPFQPTEYIPNDEDVKRYLSNIRKEKAMRKQHGYEKLISTAF